MNEGYAIKKPIPVHFVQWEGKHGEPPQVKQDRDYESYGIIETLEGAHKLHAGDYVMGPGAAGEYWPIKRAIFEATYDVQQSNGDGKHE